MRWLPLLGLLCACAAPRPVEQEQTALWRGSRQKSGSLKASEERPRGGAEPERGPFSTDHMEIEAHAERRRQQHREGHSKRLLVLEQFAHPACSGLESRQRSGCPLLGVKWERRREVEGGVLLEGRAERDTTGPLLQRQVLCHIAFARTHGHDDGCALQLPGVRASVVQRGSKLQLRVVTPDASRVGELRQRMKILVPIP